MSESAPSHFAKTAKLSLDLIQRRDDMKRLLGDRYQSQVDMARAILRGSAKEHKRDMADEALQIAKRMSSEGHDPSLIIAALVDECEGL